MAYRRNWIKGGTFFFTVTLQNRQGNQLTEHITSLRNAFSAVKQSHPFRIDAIVILPEHLHTIWTLPEGDANFATRWRLIKSRFSRNFPHSQSISSSQSSKKERGIWQRRYWEHTVRDELDFKHHIDYIHYNPVKHGYVQCPADWPFSSIHQFIANGDLSRDWGSSIPIEDLNQYGE